MRPQTKGFPVVSALTRRGSTRAWRRLRVRILGRDAVACQVPVAVGPPPTPGSWAHTRGHRAICARLATHVDHAEVARVNQAPTAVDNPDDLRATCAPHNLSKGKKSATEFDQGTNQAPRTQPTRWEW